MSTATKQILKSKKKESVVKKELLELKSMTKGDKKNKNIKIIPDCKIHNYWSNIFRRKFEMHEYFSEAAFGSQTDTKVEYRNLWEDPEYIKKYVNQSDVEHVPPTDQKDKYLSIDKKDSVE